MKRWGWRHSLSAASLPFPLAQRRWQSDRAAFAAATREVPKTPSGANPYDVFNLAPGDVRGLAMEDIAKQFKKLAVQHHPDRQGGSHDKMAELNAAFGIIKQWHQHVLKQLDAVKLDEEATKHFRREQPKPNEREQQMGRTGGLRENVRAMNQRMKHRSPAEIVARWEEFREDRQDKARRMGSRFEVAIEQGVFFKKAGTLNEITVRERWLRKQFIKAVWEDIHEMRTELLHKGARNVQMSQVAEEMVSFATQMQQKLDDDFKRLAQQMFLCQLRFQAQRFFNLVVIGGGIVLWLFKVATGIYYNSYALRYKEAFMATGSAAA